MKLHFGSYINIPQTRWAEDPVDVHSLCAPVLCLLSHCSLALTSGLTRKLPVTPMSVQTCLLMRSPKSCATLTWGDTVTNMTMCKSSDLLKQNPNCLKLTTSNLLNTHVESVRTFKYLTSRGRLDKAKHSKLCRAWSTSHYSHAFLAFKHIQRSLSILLHDHFRRFTAKM